MAALPAPGRSGNLLSQIERDLDVTRKDVRTWVTYYKNGGIKALRRMNFGGRPRKTER